MDAGLSNLWTLKAHLLPEAIRARPTYDETMLTLGRGTAWLMQRHCNRELARVAGATHTAEAGDRTVIVLPRYPIEEVTAVELRTRPTDPWESQDLDCIARIDHAAGLVILESPMGIWHSMLRLTYTGGYWWSTTEPPDAEAQPAGSTALPADLQLAWLLQCEHTWSQRDRLGTGIAAGPGERSKIADVTLLEGTVEALRPYLRHG